MIANSVRRVITSCLVAGGLTALSLEHVGAATAVVSNVKCHLQDGAEVYCAVRQPDGKVIIGGDFSFVNDEPRNNIARLNPDGTVDTNWNPNVSGALAEVYVLALDGTNIYVAGYFTTIGGLARNSIARLNNTDGAADPNWDANASGYVLALAVDGTNIYVGGSFIEIGGESRDRIARLSKSNGAVDTNWNLTASWYQWQRIWAFGVSDTNIYVAGGFTNIGGLGRNFIARFNDTDGTVDPNWNPNASYHVDLLALDGTNIYAGGSFTNIGGLNRNYIARLNDTDGSADPNWNPDPSLNVSTLAVDGTNIYVGGSFTNIGGLGRNRIARLNDTDGSADTNWNPDANDWVGALAVDGTNIYAGGRFTGIGVDLVCGIAKLNPATGAKDTTWNTGTFEEGEVRAIAVQPDGKVLIGGDFQVAGGVLRNNIVRLNTDSSVDTNWNPNAEDEVKALTVDGTNIYAGGDFTSIGGLARSRIARLNNTDGAADPNWDPNASGGYGWVITLTVDGTNIYVGGSFTNIGGLARNSIARLNTTDGSADATWNPNVGGSFSWVNAVAADGTNIYAGGYFTNIGGLACTDIARLSHVDGSADMNWAPNPSRNVLTLVTDGTFIYAGGQFTNIGGLNRTFIARLNNTDGACDPNWDPDAGYGTIANVHALAVDGTFIYAGGQFTNIGGFAVSNFVRLNKIDGAADPNWNLNADKEVVALAVDGTNIYVGGYFTRIGDQVRICFAALSSGLGPVPSAPSGVSATDGTYTDKIQVTWNDVSAATGYQVWRNTTNSSDSAGKLSNTSDTSYDDTSAETDVIYYYWVKATNASGASAFSTPDSGYKASSTTSLDAPTNVSASDGTYTDKVAVSWSAVTNATGYGIWRNTSDSSSSASTLGETSNTSYDDTSASAGTTYYYWVKATNTSVTSDFSSSDSGWRSLSAPEGVTATDGTYTDKIRVTWNSVTGAASYEVWRNTSDSSSSASKFGDATDTTYDDTSATPTTTYYYWIKAKNSLGAGGFSEGDSGWRRSAASTDNADSDLDGDGLVDVTVYHEESGYWVMLMSASGEISYQKLGEPGYSPIPGDFDGDGKTDLAVYQESSGYWYILCSGTDFSLSYMSWGGIGWEPVPADFDGDGESDLAVYCESGDMPGYWFIFRSTDYGLSYMSWGGTGYEPVPADFDGDGKSDIAVYCESGDMPGYWFIFRSTDLGLSYMPFGGSGYEPVPADYDGDGKADLAVYNESSGYWYIWLSGSATLSYQQLGESGYSPVPGDYDGDGKADLAVYHESSGYWCILLSETGTISYLQFGGPGYVPVGVVR